MHLAVPMSTVPFLESQSAHNRCEPGLGLYLFIGHGVQTTYCPAGHFSEIINK